MLIDEVRNFIIFTVLVIGGFGSMWIREPKVDTEGCCSNNIGGQFEGEIRERDIFLDRGMEILSCSFDD